MRDLHQALEEIGDIRRQVARTTEFRGYGPVTLAATGIFALLASALQTVLIPAAAAQHAAYLLLWIVTAALSTSLAGAQMYARSRRMHSGLSGEMLRLAVEQFLPAVCAGALLTAVISLYAPTAFWLLPGLWQILFALGVFSSCRFLPRLMLVPASWYLLSGLLCIAGGESRALSPWTMGVGFGAGQFLVAGVLYVFGTQGEA